RRWTSSGRRGRAPASWSRRPERPRTVRRTTRRTDERRGGLVRRDRRGTVSPGRGGPDPARTTKGPPEALRAARRAAGAAGRHGAGRCERRRGDRISLVYILIKCRYRDDRLTG